MAYVKPMVMVFQEYASTSATTTSAELPPCIIGPCYSIVSNEDEEISYVGEYKVAAGFSGKQLPNLTAGVKVDASTVVYRFKDCRIQFPAKTNIYTSKSNAVTVSVGNFPENVAVGDYVTFYDQSDVALSAEYRVIGLDSASRTVLINKVVPTGAKSFQISRIIDEMSVKQSASPAGYSVDENDKCFTIAPGAVTYQVSAQLTLSVVSAKCYVGYKGLRSDLKTVHTIASESDLKAVLGDPTPENPLAYGVQVCLANTTTSVLCIGVESDDLAGYTDALGRASEADPCYALVPLTMDQGILGAFKTHCVEMSTAEKGRWRIAFGCSPLQTETEVTAGHGNAAKDDDNRWVLFNCTGGVITGSTGAETTVNFISEDVQAGDELVLTKDGVEYSYEVSSVVSEDILGLSSEIASALCDNASPIDVEFTVVRKLDKDGQAEAIASVSESYASSDGRFIHVWPDTCVIEDVELPGYYLCCAVAGGVAGLPSQYGFTRLSMAGIDGIVNSNDYFSSDQLDVIADGGTFIFVQPSESALPYVRHQLTTDRSTLERQELSFVKNFDYVSYICRDALDEYLGLWNVNTDTMASIRTTLNSVFTNLQLNSQPKIGAPIISYSIGDIAQLEDTRDRIEVYVDVTFPYPLNTIGLHIVSQ